ncbi:MAG: sulfotransferase family protein, partial [Waterburya sp.]
MKLKQQPLAGSSFVNWIKLLFVNGGIDNKYITRGIYITLITFCGIPFIIMEKAKIRTQIEKTRLEECPVFIIGYWRSGTTYLHNLM